MHDPAFGRLAWDPLLGCWLGGIDWPPGLHTEVAIWPRDGDTAAAIRQARAGLAWLQRHEADARRTVAEQMAGVYNNAWRGDGEPVPPAQFASRIELVRIGFEADGDLLLSYGAGELFGGHVIDGAFGPDRAFRRATLVG